MPGLAAQALACGRAVQTHEIGVQSRVERGDQQAQGAELLRVAGGLLPGAQQCRNQTTAADAGQGCLSTAAVQAGFIQGALAGTDITPQAPVAVAGVGVAPTDQVNLQPLFQRVLDQAVAGAEVKQVEAVDRRRHQQQRALMHLRLLRGVANQLELGVACDHLTRRTGQISAEAVLGVQVGLREGAPAGQILPQVMRSAAQAVSTAGAGFSQNRRVEQAVAGGCGGGQLVEQPAQLSALMVGQLQALQPLRQRLLPGLPELQQALGGGPLPAGVSKTWVVVQRAQVQPALHGEQHLLKGLAQVTGVVTGLGCQAA